MNWQEKIPNEKALKWIQEIVELTKASHVHVCTGSNDEYEQLCSEMVQKGTLIPLNHRLRPNSFLARSHPEDVSRSEGDTYICSLNRDNAGPTNNWCDPHEMQERLKKTFQGCMEGRTLYVIAFSMGPLNSPLSHIGIQLTDSPYVVVSMKIMTRMGDEVWKILGNQDFVPCLHSCGMPLTQGVEDLPWPCNPKERIIAHFPETRSIWSYGSGYGGNALLGKKCFALRIASVMAHEQGWLAEHMLIMGLTSPEGKKIYIAAAFPSACGKTNLAMLMPSLPGWKVETVGDDIAWMRFAEDGQLYAINPEYGFFGVAAGTSEKTNPNAMRTLAENSLFTNTALTDEGDVYWEGLQDNAPMHLIDWHGKDWDFGSKEKAAHPNSRFTSPIVQCPTLDSDWENPRGVPISAILFGGRRSSVTPLVVESLNFAHGVFFGASISSETTAAADGNLGKLRHDPFAMLPFCGYHMGDYFAHWLKMGNDQNKKLPLIFSVNWFRKSKEGKLLWPGFRENSRVLKWIFERVTEKKEAELTPIGYIPGLKGLDLSGLAISSDDLKELFKIDDKEWQEEADRLEKYFMLFGPKLPNELSLEVNQLRKRLKNGF